MKKPLPPIECHINALISPTIDPVLEAEGFTHGLLSFSIAPMGILFKCRARGSVLDLEFSAFFALLKFFSTKLKHEKVKAIRVFSSMPEFVFSFTPGSPNIHPKSERYKLLQEYSKGIKVEIGYIELYRNNTRVSASDFPALPKNQVPAISPDFDEIKKSEYRPFQKGVIV